MHNPQTTESAQKCILLFFWVIHDEISKVHITRSIYYNKLADLTKGPKDPSFY